MPSIYYNNNSILSSADSILYENTVGYGPATPPTNNHLKHGKRRSWHIMPNKVLYFIIIILSIKTFSVLSLIKKSSSNGMEWEWEWWIWSDIYLAMFPAAYTMLIYNILLRGCFMYVYTSVHSSVYSRYACLFVHWILFRHQVAFDRGWRGANWNCIL